MQQNQRFSLYFYIFAVAHLLLWTLLPTFLRYDLPLDSIEAVSWGYEWQLGYLKHPPLSGWMAEGMMKIFPGQMWAIYFLAQICVVITFFATWKLANEFLSREKALMSILLLEAIYYYNFTSIEFNANIALMPLWSLATLCAWRVVKNPQSKISWIIFAIICALAIHAKYYSVMLFGGIFLLFLCDKNLRKIFLTINPYLFAIVFFALIYPHFSWLVENDFVSFVYAKNRATPTETHFYDRLVYPLFFLLAQAASLLLPTLLFFGARSFDLSINCKNNLKSKFLIFIGIVPLILAIAPSILSGNQMKDMWGSMMWSWFGVALFYFFDCEISSKFRRIFYRGIFVVCAISVVAMFIVNLSKPNKYGHFNGKLLVEKIHEKHPEKISIVVGDVWLASNMNFFDQPRPHVLASFDHHKSSENSLSKLEKEGGIIMWNRRYYGNNLPNFSQEKISNKIDIQEPIDLPFVKFPKSPPYQVGWAIVAPK